MGVLGIAGLAFACEDAGAIREWYARHLLLDFSKRGEAEFAWRVPSTDRRLTSGFAPLEHGSPRFDAGVSDFVVRYWIEDLDAAVERLGSEGETVVVEGSEHGGGRVGWAVDPDGRKVELSEPVLDVADSGPSRGHVRGVGGVFFRSGDVTKLKSWYEKLGIVPGEGGYVIFPSLSIDGRESVTAWEIFPDDTTYFDSAGEKTRHAFMVNFRVSDLDAMLAGLREAGVWVDPKTEAYEYGKFGWIVDPRGARVELWEPGPGPE